MTDYEPGDVVLVPFPFGERAGGRKRPALIISSREYNEATGELIVAQITGRASASPQPGDSLIEDWKQANLPRPASVRPRLATLQATMALRKLGTLTESDWLAARKALAVVLDN